MVVLDLERLVAHPVRIVPFDLGRKLETADIDDVKAHCVAEGFALKSPTQRQRAILKDLGLTFSIQTNIDAFLFETGILVVVINESARDYSDQKEHFSIAYGEDRKRAHEQLFHWTHPSSACIWEEIETLRGIVKKRSGAKTCLRPSASPVFENGGFSYVMTLSLFDTNIISQMGQDFADYPAWLQRNLYALLDPSTLYLEDSSAFSNEDVTQGSIQQALENIRIESAPVDYERHRHVATYMSWAAVVMIGQITTNDREEYTALEVQLQSDWYYVYCLGRSMAALDRQGRSNIMLLQRQHYELSLLADRLFDFDDSSVPSRVITLQKGLVMTSGLQENLEALQKQTVFIIEHEKSKNEIKQRRLAQTSEVFLFVIAFIEIAPIVAEYGEHIFHGAGVLTNVLIVIIGSVLMIWKNR